MHVAKYLKKTQKNKNKTNTPGANLTLLPKDRRKHMPILTY